MRVLIVVHGFPPNAEAGSEIYADTLARTLHHHVGDDVTVFTRESDVTRPEYELREYEREGVRVVSVNNTFREVRSFDESYLHPRLADIFDEVLARLRPDVAHIHHLTCLSTLLPARLTRAGVPYVVTLHDYWMLCHRGQLFDRNGCICEGPAKGCTNCVGPVGDVPAALGVLAPLAAQLRQRAPAVADTVAAVAGAAARRADQPSAEQRRLAHMLGILHGARRVLALSESLRRRFVENGLSESRTRLWALGFDAEPHRSSRSHPEQSLPLRLGFVGTLMISKAPHVLFEAVDGLPDGFATVDVYGDVTGYHGDDSYSAVLSRWTQSPRVRFHGHLAHASMADALRQMSVLVMTSVWPENSPLVIREAFLAGVVVVAPRIGGIPELIEHDVNGLLYEPGDVDGLRIALRRLGSEPGLVERLRSHQTTVRTIEDDASETHRIYEEVLGDHQHSAPDAQARVHAVVLNYDTPDQTLITVRSLLASQLPLARVTVIDNSDNVACGRTLADVADAVDYFSMPENRGFAGGMNAGIRRALAQGATHVLLVNSDVTVPPDAVGKALAALASQPSAGIAGARVVHRRTPNRIESSGIAFAPGTGRVRLRDHGEAAAASAVSHVVDAVHGCFMLIDRATLEIAGDFDESYFFGFEDIEFCLRAQVHGRRSVVSTAVVHHEGGASLPSASTDRLYYAARNHLALTHRYGTGIRAARLASAVVLNLASALRSSPRRWPARLSAVAGGVRDFLQRRSGPCKAG